MKRGLIKSKKAQGIFGMPFSVIFSIFLIAIFLVVAFYAIRYFLGLKECSETGLFKEDLQDAIDSAWQSQSSSKKFSNTLPSAIEYACFADLNERATGNFKEKEIYAELRRHADYTANLFFYPQKEACVPSTNIEHVNVTSNPYCIPVESGKIEIKIEKGFYDALVKVSRL